MIVRYVIEVEATEPPPNWEQQVYERLSREVDLMFRGNGRVRRSRVITKDPDGHS